MKKDNYPKLYVEFLGCSKDPLAILYSAFQINNPRVSASDVWRKLKSGEISRKAMETFVEERIGGGFSDTLRQVQFIFLVNNLSTTSATRFNRHHIGINNDDVFQHYLNIDLENQIFVTPPDYSNHKAVLEKWHQLQQDILNFYQYCVHQGIQADDARYALPMGTISKEQFSMGFQGLQQFLDIHLCEMTHWELREMAWQIFHIMKKEFPNLASRLGIKCWENRNLYCNEDHGSYSSCKWCQARPHKNDLTEMWGLNQKTS